MSNIFHAPDVNHVLVISDSPLTFSLDMKVVLLATGDNNRRQPHVGVKCDCVSDAVAVVDEWILF